MQWQVELQCENACRPAHLVLRQKADRCTRLHSWVPLGVLGEERAPHPGGSNASYIRDNPETVPYSLIVLVHKLAHASCAPWTISKTGSWPSCSLLELTEF